MFAAAPTEPVTSEAGMVGTGAGGATGPGAMRLTLGVGAMSVSAADWRLGSGAAAGAATMEAAVGLGAGAATFFGSAGCACPEEDAGFSAP